MVLGWKSYHHHLTDIARIGEKLHKQVNDGRSRRGECLWIVWFAALYRVPIFLGEYSYLFYFLMTFLKYCAKIHAQSSLAWALYRVNSMIQYIHTVVKPLPPSSPGDSHPAKLWPFAPRPLLIPLPQALVTTSLLSASVFTALGTSHRWIHSTFPSRFTWVQILL